MEKHKAPYKYTDILKLVYYKSCHSSQAAKMIIKIQLFPDAETKVTYLPFKDGPVSILSLTLSLNLVTGNGILLNSINIK